MKIPHPRSRGWTPHPLPACTPTQKFWLFRPGALTAGLRQLGEFRLRVLAEYAQAAPADEARAMRLRPGSMVWVREVLMSVDGIDAVAARSLTPLEASRGIWQGMRRLRTRPLADMLYHDRTVRRTAFECRRLAPGVPFYATARAVVAEAADGSADGKVVDIRYWPRGANLNMNANPHGARQAAIDRASRILARRSVFWRHGQPLLVAEGFMPGFWDKAGDRRPA
ncbi:chorismate--pyruvate lyase [Bordetella genomosp. 9]|uniref:Probable chorismate pyruvate-lyase n=1 Tax=Bordetella genomosp. 9 TaxID=1416803 RepID=A0A261R377_9BORD|nr:chorismate lyase [Bordetella genomosp. 9]OZI19092.1 chorismate--pyruvate lyase [Bordetella genomosp. 9]